MIFGLPVTFSWQCAVLTTSKFQTAWNDAGARCAAHGRIYEICSCLYDINAVFCFIAIIRNSDNVKTNVGAGLFQSVFQSVEKAFLYGKRTGPTTAQRSGRSFSETNLSARTKIGYDGSGGAGVRRPRRGSKLTP